MALEGFQYEPVRLNVQYEPVRLNVNEDFFEEEQDIPNSREKSMILKNTEWFRCGKWGVMHTTVEYLSCDKV